MQLFYKTMLFPKIADASFNFTLNKIFYNDKIFFDVLERLQEQIATKESFYERIFLKIIDEFIKGSKSDKFFDNIFRRLIKIMSAHIVNEKNL